MPTRNFIESNIQNRNNSKVQLQLLIFQYVTKVYSKERLREFGFELKDGAVSNRTLAYFKRIPRIVNLKNYFI